jgi:hypothetical protein
VPAIAVPDPAVRYLLDRLAKALWMDRPAGYSVAVADPSTAGELGAWPPAVRAYRGAAVSGRDLPTDCVVAVDITPAVHPLRELFVRATAFAEARVDRYWVLDHSRADISLTELVFDPERSRYCFGLHTTDVISATDPWPITIDLPELSRRRAELLASAQRIR